jgi:DNA-directed RNA polymerase subunit E'
MFYLIEVEDHVRVEPKLFGLSTLEAVENQLKESYSEYYDQDMGRVVSILEVLEVGEGTIIPGDGAAYYKSKFKLLVWKPALQELIFGKIDEIATFGAFINMGVMKGMIHISQTMDDYVSFSDSNSLQAKSSSRSLKPGDLCLARVVAYSHKGDEPKIGLTMRQPGLGKLEWIEQEKEEQKKKKNLETKETKSNGGKK